MKDVFFGNALHNGTFLLQTNTPFQKRRKGNTFILTCKKKFRFWQE